MSAAFDGMTGGEALAELRRNNQRADDRKAHLAAMRMASEGQRDSPRNAGKDVGIMRQQENGSVSVCDRRERSGQIMPTGPKVADASDPKCASGSVEPNGCVLNDADTDRFNCLPHAIMVEPTVMVAEDGHDSGGSSESCQLGSDLFRWHEAPTEHTLNDEVTQNADDVRFRRVGAIDCRVELGHTVEW
jgi:hypothetical protein